MSKHFRISGISPVRHTEKTQAIFNKLGQEKGFNQSQFIRDALKFVASKNGYYDANGKFNPKETLEFLVSKSSLIGQTSKSSIIRTAIEIYFAEVESLEVEKTTNQVD